MIISGPQAPSDLISSRTLVVSPWTAAIQAWRRAGISITSPANSAMPAIVRPISIQGTPER